jgi:Ca2+-binding RTX toxin-like protein
MFARNQDRPSINSIEMQPLEARRLRAVDLSVTSIQIIDGMHDERFVPTTAAITVTNFGNQAVLPKEIDLRLHFSVDDVWGNEDDLSLSFANNPSALGAGESWTYMMNGRASAQPAGSYRLLAYVDGFGLISESNEDNNQLASDAGSVVYSSGELDSTDIYGTGFNDVISVTADDENAYVTMNGNTKHMKLADIPDHLFIDAGAGNDLVTASPDFPVKLAITGSSGKDVIVGGAKNDELSGGTGADRIFGGLGHDFLIGGAQGDRLFGEAGDDLLLGAGGIDFLYGGEGANNLIGGAGNDRFFAKGNTGIDTISGNDGDDWAEVDPTDVLASIETTV